MAVLSSAWRWIRERPYAVSTLLLVVLVGFIIGINRVQDERERREDAVERVELAEHDARIECISNNESRELIREIGVQLAVSNADALITVVTDETAEEAAAFRLETLRRASETVSVLHDRDCVTEAKDAREAAAEIEGIYP